MDRMQELQANLQDVEREISQACVTANRNRDDVTLIAVTKTWPASDVDLLAQLGITDVGENRDQEAKPKHDEVTAKNLTWHAIGQLQTNKAKEVAKFAHELQSLDRLELAEALDRRDGGAEHLLAVSHARSMLLAPDLLPSARVLQAMHKHHGDSFVAFARGQSVLTHKHLLGLPWSAKQQARFEAMAAQSMQDQRAIEAADTMPFEIYRQEYTSPTRLGRPQAQANPVTA